MRRLIEYRFVLSLAASAIGCSMIYIFVVWWDRPQAMDDPNTYLIGLLGGEAGLANIASSKRSGCSHPLSIRPAKDLAAQNALL